MGQQQHQMAQNQTLGPRQTLIQAETHACSHAPDGFGYKMPKYMRSKATSWDWGLTSETSDDCSRQNTRGWQDPRQLPPDNRRTLRFSQKQWSACPTCTCSTTEASRCLSGRVCYYRNVARVGYKRRAHVLFTNTGRHISTFVPGSSFLELYVAAQTTRMSISTYRRTELDMCAKVLPRQALFV